MCLLLIDSVSNSSLFPQTPLSDLHLVCLSPSSSSSLENVSVSFCFCFSCSFSTAASMTRRHELSFSRFASFFLLLLTRTTRVAALSYDGVLLLSFKYAVLSDPAAVLQSWNYDDQSPCGWRGVACESVPSQFSESRVVGLALPNSQLLGSVVPDLGLIEKLRELDLSGNLLNGSLPESLFNASELRVLSLANNEISGELPELVGNLHALESLTLSDNAFTGRIPENLTNLPNLTRLSLSNNYFTGRIPANLEKVEIFDVALNLVNGTLDSTFGAGLKYLNVSSNRLTGEIPPQIPANATVDLSFNNFTGEVPKEFSDQKGQAFTGNPNLCGKPLKNPCLIPSTLSTPPNVSNSPPAIAAIPKIEGPIAAGIPTSEQQRRGGLKPGVIAGIVVGDLAGIGILSIIILCVYQSKKKKKKKRAENSFSEQKAAKKVAGGTTTTKEWSSPESGRLAWSCLRNKGGVDGGSSSSDSTGSETEEEGNLHYHEEQRKKGSLVTVDGDTELEMETLLKASAYILGATGSSIVYKAVMEDGTTLAVRRIGETGVDRFRDFENQVRLYAKLRHPNILRIRGFYWGDDEKLIIYDYVPNGSLASVSYKKMGSSPLNLPWELRLRIARGVAKGLSYLHEKKYVHSNLKPSNILLGVDMDPKIGDFGLERLLAGDNSSKRSGSARQFGSKRSTVSRDSFHEIPTQSPAAVGASPISANGGVSPYQAPELLKNLKPNPKWDVYSFGVLLLELLSGKVFSEKELTQWNAGFGAEEKTWVLRMVDGGLRSELEGKEEAFLACFKLGFSCASVLPQRRPSMKEALQLLEKLPSSSSSMSSLYSGNS